MPSSPNPAPPSKSPRRRPPSATLPPPPKITLPEAPTSPTTSDLAAALALADVLRALGLEHAAAILDAALQKAIARNDSPSSVIDHLMRDQLRVHLEDRARTAVKRSAIFPITTLDTYDFKRPTSIDRDLVERAASLDFVRERTNVVFVGPSGVGKTHLANAIGYLACVAGYRVRFALAADLVNDLVGAQVRNTLSKRLTAWAAHDLLLIDELGYLSFDSRGADLLYQVINKRYLRASTIVTTNLAFKDWGTLFHGTAAATAIADRLVHKGLLVRIVGDSVRPGTGSSGKPTDAA
jgi:DNA replication protein DnaC